MQYRYNIELLKKSALGDLETWLRRWYPNGQLNKDYFEIGNIAGDKGQSLKVNLRGLKRGLWYDFAANEGGDIFSLWGYHRQLSNFGNILTDIAEYYKIAINNQAENWSAPSSVYRYFDSNGDVNCYVYRFDKPDGKKEFRPWNPIIKSYSFPEPRILYNLPQVLKASRIVLVEGEKCADALNRLGLVATTLMGGANCKIEKTDLTPLAGKKIILWSDNDQPGQRYVQNLCQHLSRIALNLKITPLTPNKPLKWDAADAVAENFDISSHLSQAVDYVEYDTKQSEIETESKATSRKRIIISDFTAKMFDSRPPEIQYLVDHTIPRGTVGLLSAMGDTGKGMLLLDLALKICQDKNGLELKAFGNRVLATGSVVIFAGEDTADEIHRRIYKLLPQGVDNLINKNKLHIIPLPNAGGPFNIAIKSRGNDEFRLSDDFLDIQSQLLGITDLSLIIFDPLSSFAGLDINSDPRAASFITGHLAALATKTNSAIIIAHHIRKNDGITTPLEAREAIRGTSAIVDGVRFAISFWPNVQEEKKIFQELQLPFRSNACFKGAVVKANFGADRTIRNYLRSEDRAVLEELPFKIIPKVLKSEEFEAILIKAVGEAQTDGKSFAISGASGLYENRKLLPLELQEVSRDFIRNTAKKLVSNGKLIKINLNGSGEKKWLGIPTRGESR